MTDPDVHGPIDTTIIEFPPGASGAETVGALVSLVEAGTVRLYDLMVIAKGEDGDVVELDISAPADGGLEAFGAFAGARSGLLGDEDLAVAAEVLEPGTMAMAMVYENTWAVPVVAAARAEGAELVASARLSAQDIMDALDAVEASD